MDGETPTIEYLAQQLQDLTDLIRNHRHTGYDLTPKLRNATVSTMNIVNASTLGDGVSQSGTLTMLLAAGQGDVFLRAGLDAGDFANAAAKTGFIMGIDDSDSDKVKFYFGSPTAYISFDGASITSVGAFSVSQINIPDTTTASSFHVDSSGNSWWGSNIATGLAGANASITATGLAKFKNIYIGGTSIQYQATNAGVFSFGDGSDGAGVADGSTALAGATLAGSTYTLTRDVYFTDLTVSTGVTIKPAGYRIFGTGELTLNGTGHISGDGNAGAGGYGGGDVTSSTASPGTGGSRDTNGRTAGLGGAGGAALADGYLKGSLAGMAGGNGGAGNFLATGGVGSAGGAGSNTTNSIGANASAAIAGGGGGDDGAGDAGGAGGAAGASGTVTISNVKLIANWHLATLLDISSSGSTVKFDNSASAGGSGGGGGGTSTAVSGANGGGGGGGGGSGSSGRIIAIYFRSITIGASASITANGGAGGVGGHGGNSENGGAGTKSGGGGGGGGGTGGNGGQIILVYNQLSNSGTLSAAGGTGGTGGTGGAALGTGVAGTNGANGNTGGAGSLRSFQISM